MRVADDLPRRVERIDRGLVLCGDRERRERHENARDDRSTLHFKSALIAAGGSNVAGSTWS